MLWPFKKVFRVSRGYHNLMRKYNFETLVLARQLDRQLHYDQIFVCIVSLILLSCFDTVHLHTFSVSSPTSVIAKSPFHSRIWCCTTGRSASDILKAQFSFELSSVSYTVYVATYPRKTEASIILPWKHRDLCSTHFWFDIVNLFAFLCHAIVLCVQLVWCLLSHSNSISCVCLVSMTFLSSDHKPKE